MYAIEIIDGEVVPFLENLEVFTCQHDNARLHSSRIAQSSIDENGSNVLPWLASLIDLIH